MKKLVLLILCTLLLFPAAVFAEAEQDESPVPEWLELSADDTVLTVRLPVEEVRAQSWRFFISNETILQLITCETVGDEEGESGPAAWVGSFMGSFDKGGHVFLQLSPAGADALPAAHMLHLFIREDRSIEIVSVEEDSWYWLDEDQCVLTVSLPANPSTGYAWTYSLTGEDALQCLSEEYVSSDSAADTVGAGGLWTAQYGASFKKAGHATLTLSYSRPWESKMPEDVRTLRLFVNEAGLIEPVAMTPENDAPVGLYVSPDSSTLAIYRRADGTFSMDLSIFRLTAQDDGIGEYRDGVMTVTATDAAGNPMVWEIVRNPAGLSARVAESTWSYLPEGETFEFVPAE